MGVPRPRGFLSVLAIACCLSRPAFALEEKPRIVVFVVVDGLGAEALENALPRLPGFRALAARSERYENAFHDHASTVTSPGHASIATGEPPSKHGVISNSWVERSSRRVVSSVDDDAYPVLESVGGHSGVSPKNLKVPAWSDHLVTASSSRARAFSVSGKATSAVFMAGHRGTAYFYDDAGRFATSAYYRKDYPEWWHRFFSRNPAVRFGSTLLGESADPADPEAFAEALVRGERLGVDPEATDFLALCYTKLDLSNHAHGPESAPSARALEAIDRSLARFIRFLDKRVGADGAVFVLTSDHGFPPVPRKGRGGVLEFDRLVERLGAYLTDDLGAGNLVLGAASPWIYLDREKIRAAELDYLSILAVSRKFLETQEGVERVFTPEDWSKDDSGRSEVERRVARVWDAERAGDLYLLPRRFWFAGSAARPQASSHGSPYGYDAHVPLWIAGPGAAPGARLEPVTVREAIHRHLWRVFPKKG